MFCGQSLKKSLWRSFIKQYKPLWNWWDPNKRHALLGRGLLSQPMRGQLLLLRTNGNQAFCSAIWQLKWNLSGLVGAILTDFRPIRSRKTSPEGSCCQLLFTFCLLVVHVICFLRQIESPNQTLTGWTDENWNWMFDKLNTVMGQVWDENVLLVQHSAVKPQSYIFLQVIERKAFFFYSSDQNFFQRQLATKGRLKK